MSQEQRRKAMSLARNSTLGAGAIIAAVFLIEPWEGEVKNAQGEHVVYIDATGTPTVCAGITQDFSPDKLVKGDTYTDEQCEVLEAKALTYFEKEVNKAVKTPYTSVFQEAAFISFSWNSGAPNFKSSTLLKLKNEGKDDLVCDQLLRWVYSKGVKLNGLVNRRGEERQYCLGEVSEEVNDVYNTIAQIIGNKHIGDKQFSPTTPVLPISRGAEGEEQQGNNLESYSQCQHSRFYCWISNSWRNWGKSSY